MSSQYQGNIVKAVPTIPANNYASTPAPGVWSVNEVNALLKQNKWPTPGVSNPNAYIENLFSTYLYTGNGTSQTINNGIDLAGQGGLVWMKARSGAISTALHALFDTTRGGTKVLNTPLTLPSYTYADGSVTFASTGFSVSGADTSDASINYPTNNYASWTFRKQPKFFDIVTYTGTGAAQNIAHSLGSAPRCMFVKRTDTTGNWCVYHSDLGATKVMFLNTTAAAATDTTYWNSTNPITTTFSVGTNTAVNASGGTYVAYLFASDAGGFGLSGTDNVITCGSFVSGGTSGNTVTLGYEPQWVLVKSASVDDTQGWQLIDTMRGFSQTGYKVLFANTNGAELSSSTSYPTATGFFTQAGYYNSGATYIYIAIRRGPMQTPTDGTKVYNANLWTGTSSPQTISGPGFPLDWLITSNRNIPGGATHYAMDRMRGLNPANPLMPNSTSAEVGPAASVASNFGMSQYDVGTDGAVNYSGSSIVGHAFRRAPGFFDVVCYTGNDVNGRAVAHSLSSAPELMVIKCRNVGLSWIVYSQTTGINSRLFLNGANAADGSMSWQAAPTASAFYVPGAGNGVNTVGQDYVAYLFATCPGVSKVGSYTGNGTSQTINCGFTGGARFVLIKRTDAVGDWYVYDTARGMTTLTDPYLLMNSTAAETATLGSVTSVTTGFSVNATVLPAINTNGASYIYLAIA